MNDMTTETENTGDFAFTSDNMCAAQAIIAPLAATESSYVVLQAAGVAANPSPKA